MKKVFWSIVLLAAVFAGSAAQAKAQQITGGYAKTAIGGRDVRAAANFAIAELQKRQAAKLELLSIKQAALQVVAGTKYKLCLRVKIKGKKTSCRRNRIQEFAKSVQVD